MVGEAVGVFVGAKVGEEVGVTVGEAVGVVVGKDVGDDVGKAVALAKRWEEKYIIATRGQENNGALPPTLLADVVEVDDNFDFVVLNKGGVDKVVLGGEMLIHDNGVYVCKIKITRVLKDKSIAEVMPITRKGKPSVGNKAIVAQ